MKKDAEKKLPNDKGARTKRFPVVGIGASAGGLAAFGEFFSGMPADRDPDMAFVLIQHLAPDHKSMLTELIQRHTRMKVFEVTDDMHVEPNCVYIIPPNCDMAFLNGSLQLLEPGAPHGRRMPIDFFFRSLAADQLDRAICIILSGTGSDGTFGARAIKDAGGMIMAQRPDSTQYDGMPRSVITAGLADYELPPPAMPEQLLTYVTHAFNKPPFTAPTDDENNDQSTLKKIFVLLRARTRHDFSHYKPNTVNRRIDRRMAVNQIPTREKYLRYLKKNEAELDVLFREMLIGVTRFFRDTEAFTALEKEVIPTLFSAKNDGDVLRIWVTGCSTGEEAYSIAILLQEQQEQLKRNHPIQIFATDIDERAITSARTGLFPAGIAQDVSPERLTRFFSLEPGGSAYRIKKALRDMLVFSEQDLIKDPPFSRLDLVSCRNVLIYMGSELQKKLIPLFHYALNPHGVLFLGTSEAVGEFDDLFEAIDRKAKLFRRKESLPNVRRKSFGNLLSEPDRATRPVPKPEKPMRTKMPTVRQLTEQTILKQVQLVAALVNGKGDILYLHGRAGLYLEPATGEAGINNILKMAREGLRAPLTTALHKTRKNNESVSLSDVHIKTNGHFTSAHLTIRPAAGSLDGGDNEPLFLVILEEAPCAPGIAEATEPPDADASVAVLKKELHAKEEYLRAANEELETSNEELQSSNEEMQSINEELQSTNEELETSKEELQSVNEELTTVNSELQTKVTDLAQSNNDMNNLLAGTGIGTVFLDLQLNILRFTPAITGIINLIPGDVGRPVGHIVSNFSGYDRLSNDTAEVLETLISKEVDVQTTDDRWYTMRIQPYRTLNNVIEGAVITFVDITEIKAARAKINEAQELSRLAAVIKDSRDAITVHDMQGRITAWNPAAEKIYGWSEEEALKMNVYDMIPKSTHAEEKEKLQQLIQTERIEPYQTTRIARDDRTVDIWLTASALSDASGTIYAIATTEREVPK